MPDRKGKTRQIDMDTPVDTGADVADALRDLTPEQFEELMAEMGQELFGPPDPRPTRAELRDAYGPHGKMSVYDAATAPTFNLLMDRKIPIAQETPITRDQFDAKGRGYSPNSRMNQEMTFPEFLNAWQAYKDPNYPEQRDAERKARMDALKSRVRERMSRFKM